MREDGFIVARMELKVWVEGIQRIVCGVTDTTTCQDVVYALAHATGKTGRFTLIERWRNNERLLAPNEYPLKILMKWGEYSNDVQFILQRSALDPKTPNGPTALRPGGPQRVEPPSRPSVPLGSQALHDRPRQSPHVHKDLKKSLTFSGGHAELRRQEVGSPSQPLAGPPTLQAVQPPPGPRHTDLVYPTPPVTHWEGQGWTGEGSKADQKPGAVAWRPPAPPPYEVVRGNPPPPPSASTRVGVDNVRATTSHWSAPRPGPQAPLAPSHSSNAAAIHQSPSRPVPTSEPPYSTGRRDQRTDSQSLVRTEPVYSDSRRAPYPNYTHQGNIGLPAGPQYATRGPPPSQISPVYNGPKPPHIAGPRELPPYRHPPPPSSSPNKVTPSHGSPRKIVNVSQSAPATQISPTKQPPPPPVTQVPHSASKVPNPHQVTASPHSSPVRHPSPTRRPSPTRHPSPTRPYTVNPPNLNSINPLNNIKSGRSSSPVKNAPVRHINIEELPGSASHEKYPSRPLNEESNSRQGETNSRKEDGVKGDITREVLQSENVNNSVGKTNSDTQLKMNQERGSMDQLTSEGRRGTSEEPPVNSEIALSNCNERLNSSSDTALTNHNVKSPHTRRSPTKESPKASNDGGRLNHNNKVEQVVVDGKYRDLIKLINLQRDTLNNQQVEITKYEAEIAYLEGRSREDESRLAYVASEIERQENLAQQIEQEVTHLQQLEQEAEGVRQTEEKIKAEISVLQAQVTHCENQLTAHNETVRSAQELEKNMSDEKQRGQEEAKAQQEAIVREIEKLQTAIAQANAQAEHAQLTSQQLLQEVADSEKIISEKKREIEKLVMEMKDANLESLSITPSEEIRTLLEGTSKPGSSRRMIGSPRQLENAVPTSKNPHGVWV
ncbi:uncharacterized protein RASSF8 isoform X2 [Panulirus ornatus]|uniref:uncharacterized protein RASSF8 isoform X2 n=1 Tax=Panulirus ornatus TaxID=150431 RepID=UPI003A84E5F7